MRLSFSAVLLQSILTSAWVQSPILQSRSSIGHYFTPTRKILRSSPDPEDEEECPDEDECEIDWSKMPGAGDDETITVEDMQRKVVSLEMQWQAAAAAEDCDVENPQTCGGDPCLDCENGLKQCRFCRGTTVLFMYKEEALERNADGEATVTTQRPTFEPCRVCHQGFETCKRCQGSGWIAGFTQIALRP